MRTINQFFSLSPLIASNFLIHFLILIANCAGKILSRFQFDKARAKREREINCVLVTHTRGICFGGCENNSFNYVANLAIGSGKRRDCQSDAIIRRFSSRNHLSAAKSDLQGEFNEAQLLSN
jgi:hypothetical protein